MFKNTQTDQTTNDFEDVGSYEETRIIINGLHVTIENLSQNMLDVALSLNPDDKELIKRQKSFENS